MARGYPDYEGGKSGLYLKPEWAAKEGTHKVFALTKPLAAYDDAEYDSYLVPAGKVLFVHSATLSAFASAAADADKAQHFRTTLQIGSVVYFSQGGDGGATIALLPPMRINGGSYFQMGIVNKSNHALRIELSVAGYEVAA